jgi:hypothetical protein
LGFVLAVPDPARRKELDPAGTVGV